MSVAFDTEIAPHETPAFRGAVIEKVGIEHEYYHNHNNDPNAQVAFHYRYPLVQYKRQRRRPAIFFIERGVDEAQHFFTQPDWRLHFSGREYQASISDLKVRQYTLGVCDEPKYYRLRRWMGLNQKNYEAYMALEGITARTAFLEKKLVGHILAFAKGVGHYFERRFDLAILEILDARFRPFGGVQVLTFDLTFKADVLLPAYIGLGRGVSKGLGVVSRFHPNRQPRNPIS